MVLMGSCSYLALAGADADVAVTVLSVKCMREETQALRGKQKAISSWQARPIPTYTSSSPTSVSPICPSLPVLKGAMLSPLPLEKSFKDSILLMNTKSLCSISLLASEPPGILLPHLLLSSLLCSLPCFTPVCVGHCCPPAPQCQAL